MQIQWKEPKFPNGPPPKYVVEKTNIALSYPASVVRGTRFTGGGFYTFPPTVLPQNVAFTGENRMDVLYNVCGNFEPMSLILIFVDFIKLLNI